MGKMKVSRTAADWVVPSVDKKAEKMVVLKVQLLVVLKVGRLAARLVVLMADWMVGVMDASTAAQWDILMVD